MAYKIYAVDRTGALHYPDGYPDAELTSHIDDVSDLSSCEFEMPYDCKNPWLGVGTHEIQIWRNGQFFDWMVPIKRSTGGETMTVKCASLLWYFKKLVFGAANRNLVLTNPDFETDAVGTIAGGGHPVGAITGWTVGDDQGGMTATIVNDNYFTGAKGVRLANGIVLPTVSDSSLQQRVSVTTGPEGLAGVLSAWFFLENMSTPPGPDEEQRGLFLDVLDPGTGLTDPASGGPTWFPITMDTPTGVWTKAEAALEMAPSVTREWDVRLYCPSNGNIRWDTCQIAYQDSISADFTGLGTDQATMVEKIVQYAMSKWAGFNFDTNCPPTGILRLIAYQFVDHRKLWDAMQDYQKFTNGLDIGIEFTVPGLGAAGQHRTITTYYPHKSTLWDPLTLKCTVNTDTQGFQLDEDLDGDKAATSVMEMSNESGVDRTEGSYIDTTPFAGLLMEVVERAPEDTPLNELNALAQQRWKEINSGAVVPQITTKEGGDSHHQYVGILKAGDRMTFDLLPNGDFTGTKIYRVMKSELIPSQEGLKLTLNLPTF